MQNCSKRDRFERVESRVGQRRLYGVSKTQKQSASEAAKQNSPPKVTSSSEIGRNTLTIRLYLDEFRGIYSLEKSFPLQIKQPDSPDWAAICSTRPHLKCSGILLRRFTALQLLWFNRGSCSAQFTRHSSSNSDVYTTLRRYDQLQLQLHGSIHFTVLQSQLHGPQSDKGKGLAHASTVQHQITDPDLTSQGTNYSGLHFYNPQIDSSQKSHARQHQAPNQMSIERIPRLRMASTSASPHKYNNSLQLKSSHIHLHLHIQLHL